MLDGETMQDLTVGTQMVAALPHLDIHTLSEDWVLALALENHWRILGKSLGRPPSQWFDGDGERMYAGVMALRVSFDLQSPVREDMPLAVESRLTSIRKPHAISETVFAADGQARAWVIALTSFMRRKQHGSNKKFSKVRDVWLADDLDPGAVDTWIASHHAAKTSQPAPVALLHEVNRIVDFNQADFMYFKNFVRIAKAAEYRANRERPLRLNASRDCCFYGNVEDGETIRACVALEDDIARTTLLSEDGQLLFISRSDFPLHDPL